MAEPHWLVSVHDLMPTTMPRVRALVERLDAEAVAPLTLLVVPGCDWSGADIDWLHERVRRGDRLAAHGWRHRAASPRGLYDRLHRRLFSRGVAEHLALDAAGVEALMRASHAWFGAHGFAAPQLYVPPAWAMGGIPRERLRALPFRWYETLAGVYDAQTDRFRAIPLLGFEADTRTRRWFLRLFNRLNRVLGSLSGQLRVSIHPHDLELGLADDLQRLMGTPARYGAYD